VGTFIIHLFGFLEYMLAKHGISSSGSTTAVKDTIQVIDFIEFGLQIAIINQGHRSSSRALESLHICGCNKRSFTMEPWVLLLSISQWLSEDTNHGTIVY
jgi:hypothetical protein